MTPYVRTVKTASGARAVQIVHSSRRGSRDIEHIGSAHDDAGLELLKAVAAQRLGEGQDELDLGLSDAGAPGPVPITSNRMRHLWEALVRAWDALGFAAATGGDEVFRDLALARIVQPTSKLKSLRVLEEIGVPAVSYATLKRRLGAYADPGWRQSLSRACAAHAHLGPASLVLYDVSTLYYEADQGDGFREPGFSKERRIDPQITIGLLTDASGFPLMVSEFEGNKAETLTMLPTITEFMNAHALGDVVVVADAGMISEANRHAITDAGLSYIIGEKTPQIPHLLAQWIKANPGAEPEDGMVLTETWPTTPALEARGRRGRVIYYVYSAQRAKRTRHGIDAQVAKAAAMIAGHAKIARNRFVSVTGGKRALNTELADKARTLAGWKAYTTNIPDPTVEFVTSSYKQLLNVEHAFRMSKSDLAARPIYHRKRDSIQAHLTIVMAALAVAHFIETRTGWSINRFVETARRYRTITIQAAGQTITAEDPLPTDLRNALALIN